MDAARGRASPWWRWPKSAAKREQEHSVRQFESATTPKRVDVVSMTPKDMFFTVQLEQTRSALPFSQFFLLHSVTEWRRKYIHFARLQRCLARIYEARTLAVKSKSQRNSATAPSAEAYSVVVSLHMVDATVEPDVAAFVALLAAELDKVLKSPLSSSVPLMLRCSSDRWKISSWSRSAIFAAESTSWKSKSLDLRASQSLSTLTSRWKSWSRQRRARACWAICVT